MNVFVVREWYFRSSLDHWSTFLGMIFALNYPLMALWFSKVDGDQASFDTLNLVFGGR